ncbi:MAG: type II secretion system protein [Clostridia bacterium]|nr:type II secretion system protein [Clostridia bacterium]
MKKMNRKGFTIVELVIVIAVIAILAGVLIPTFSGIVKKAQDSAIQQEAAALYKQAYALDLSDGKMDGKEKDVAITKVEGTQVKYAIDATSKKAVFGFCKNDTIAEFDGAKWTVAEHKEADHVDTKGNVQDDGTETGDNICDECGLCKTHVDQNPADNTDTTADQKCYVCGAEIPANNP